MLRPCVPSTRSTGGEGDQRWSRSDALRATDSAASYTNTYTSQSVTGVSSPTPDIAWSLAGIMLRDPATLREAQAFLNALVDGVPVPHP